MCSARFRNRIINMREAVIVSSSRTPLAKSHRGSFNITRPDDLAAHCIVDALEGARLDPDGNRRSDSRLRSAARRAGPQRRAGRGAARRVAGDDGRPHGEPLLQFRPAGDRPGGAHGAARRRRGGDRRRRRVDHDDAARQLAQSGGAGAAPGTLHGDGRTPRRSSRSATTSRGWRRTNTRSSASSASRGRSRTGSSPARSRRSR